MLDAGSLHQGTRNLAGSVDYLVASEKFERQLCKTDYLQAALHIMAKQVGCVVITRGKNGLIWSKGGKIGVMDAFTVNAIYSTGSGDAFHGAFTFGLSQAMEWEALLRYASAAGALTCTSLSARVALPGVKQVEQLLNAT